MRRLLAYLALILGASLPALAYDPGDTHGRGVLVESGGAPVRDGQPDF